MAYRKNSTAESEALATLLAALRALYLLHQAHHWQSRGPSFYGDHLLFQRLYEAVLPEMDSVAERAVGSGHAGLVAAADVTRATQILLDRWQARGASPDAMVKASLSAEGEALALLDEILGAVKFSQGTQNLLQGIADKHEEHVYLLQRRLGE